MQRGKLIPLCPGLYVGGLFVTPGQFALAHIALITPEELSDSLRDRKDGTTLDDLMDIAEKRWKTTAIIEDSPIVRTGSISNRDTLSMVISSQTGTTHTVTLYNPYTDYVDMLHAEGGTTHYQKTQSRNTHLKKDRKERKHDTRFIKHMRKKFSSFSREYMRPAKILDFTHAVALTFFARHPELVKKSDPDRTPFLPFDYRNNPQAAIDFFLELETHGHYATERAGIGTIPESSEVERLLQEGAIKKGIFIQGKYWNWHATPLLHAFEEHVYEIDRRFTGQYSLEFRHLDTPWTSLVFDGPRKNVHVLYDEHHPEPLIIYKYPTTEEITANPDPIAYLNPPSKDRSVRKGKKYWIEDDFWSGKRMACYMFMPNRKIRDAAKKFK